jgi:hypothetical protein
MVRKASRIGFVIIAVALIWFWNSEWLKTDICLDGGGQWDSLNKKCQFAAGDPK